MTPALDTFIAPAKARPELWRLVLGILLGNAIYMVFAAAVVAVAGFLLVRDQPPRSWVDQVFAADTPGAMLVILATFAGMALGAFAAARLLHRRGPGSLFGRAPVVLRHFAAAVAVTTAVLLVSVGIWLLIYDPVPGISPNRWIALLPLALVGVLIQTGAEELVFRGYILQQLAARFRSPLIWAVLPSLVFGALHFDPAGAGENAILVAGAAAVFGLLAADLTARTGSLGAAWGFHFANNTLALLFLATDGALSGIALFKTPYAISDAEVIRTALIFDLAVMGAIWLILRRSLGR